MRVDIDLKSIHEKIVNSSLLKNTGTYAIANLLEKGIPFIILPIITRILPKEDVGYFTLYQALLTLFIPLLTLSIDSSILLNYFKIEKERFKIYFSNGLILFFTVFFIFSLCAVLFSDYISELIDFPVFWFFAILIVVFFQFFTTLRKNLWQISEKATKYAVFSFNLSLLKNILGLLLIIYSNLGWKGIILGHLIGQSIFALYSIFTFGKEKLIDLKYYKPYQIDLIKVGTPLSLHRIGAWLSDSLNRVVISEIIGISATGSYGIGATFGIVVTIVQDAFNRAYVPYLFKNLKVYSEKIRIELIKTTVVYYIGIFLFATAISILGYYSVGFIFGNNYNDTRNFIIPLVFAAAFNGLYKIHTNYIFFTKKTQNIMFITLSIGIINVFVVYFMVKKMGIIGAAYSTLIIQFLSYIITFYVSNRIFPIFYFKKAN